MQRLLRPIELVHPDQLHLGHPPPSIFVPRIFPR
jgi:hypothetical protein